MNFLDLRRDFGKFGLHDKKLPANPIVLFANWMEEAKLAGIAEFNAMVLSSVDADCRPSSRIVLLKEISENGGLVFYTNYLSKKGRDLKRNPNASINFYWRELERQIRVDGFVRKTSREISDKYFRTRPLESQLNAIVSPQSQPINNLSEIKSEANKLFISGKKIGLPDYWGGYELIPENLEFWQGGKNRLHDRIVYEIRNTKWEMKRLAP
jgi:pyridoxamine 5'-phosphate oxidase